MRIFIQHASGGIKYWLVASGSKFTLDTDRKKAVDVLVSEVPTVAKKLAVVVGKHEKLNGFSVYGEADKTKKTRKLKNNPRPKARGATASATKKKAARKPSKPRKKVSKASPAKKPKRCKK